MDVQALPYILLLGTIWGTTLLASRFSVGQFNPTTYVGLRLLIASLTHLSVYILRIRGRRWPIDRRLWGRAAFLGIFGTAIPMNLIMASLQHLSGGLASILISIGPVFTVLLAHVFLPDEKLTGRKAFGVALALSGAVLLVVLGESGLPDVSRASPIGYLLILGALISSNVMNIFARKHLREYDAFDVASVRMFAAASVAMPISILIVGFDLSQVNQQGYLALGYAALLGTFLGMLLAFYNIKRFGATPAAMTLYVVPVIATIGGVLVLGEQITTGMLGGMIMIILGIATLNQRVQRASVPKPY